MLQHRPSNLIINQVQIPQAQAKIFNLVHGDLNNSISHGIYIHMCQTISHGTMTLCYVIMYKNTYDRYICIYSKYFAATVHAWMDC